MEQQMILFAIAIAVASNIDTFAAGIGYGCNKIKIRFSSFLTIILIGSALLGLGMFAGSAVAEFLDIRIATVLGSIILIILGGSKIINQLVKSIVKQRQGINGKISFKLFSLKFIINICGTPEQADIDGNKLLSFGEAIFLGLALSLDNITIGLGVGLGVVTLTAVFFTILLNLVADIAYLQIGIALGNFLAKKTTLNLAWLSGLLLIVIAIFKLV